MIKKLHLNGHDLSYITGFVDENEDLVQKVISMTESDADMDDNAMVETILSQIEF